MPRHGHDYDSAKILHAKGLTIKQISDETGIPYDPLLKYAQRHEWTSDRTKAVQKLSDNVQAQLIERSTGHLLKMSGFADKALDNLLTRPIADMPLDDLQTLAQVADTFDRIARRTYGLDQQGTSHQHVHLGLLVGSSTGLASNSNILDVEVVPAEQASKPSEQAS